MNKLKNITLNKSLGKILITLVLVSIGFNTSANEAKFVNGDGSKHTEICIAAIKSDQALKEVAAKNGYSALTISQLNCNGMNIAKFAKMYRAHENSTDTKMMKVFSFDNEIKNLEADICIAAATSNDKYSALRHGLTKPISYYRAISCNGMSLTTFARKFGNKSFKI